MQRRPWSRLEPLDLGHSPLRGSAQAKGTPITMQLGPGHRGGHWMWSDRQEPSGFSTSQWYHHLSVCSGEAQSY